MKTVRFRTEWRGFQPGQKHRVTDGVARRWHELNLVDIVDDEPQPLSDSEPQPDQFADTKPPNTAIKKARVRRKKVTTDGK